MKLKKWLIPITAPVAALGLGVGVASALWTASGSGAGAGAALTAKGLVVTAVTPSGSGAALYPGGPAGWVYLTVQNQNPYPVVITNLAWGTPTSTSTASCPSANISVDAGAPSSGLSVSIAANATSGALQVFGVLDLAKTAPDGCQGVVFDIPVTVTGSQQ
ncbi:MAG TPA: hypothetical protein VKI19_05020 [Acidimicrobiales bacterium]|nr:hypothetical protein [Acidimicrobiales bacterium]